MLLSAEHLSINYGIKELVKDASLYLEPGDKIGVIGINGTGKSTFLRCLAGQETPDSGTVTRFPNVQVVFLSQNPPMDENNTVLEQVFASQDAAYREIHQYEAISMLNKLGIEDPEAKVGILSGGQRKRVALAAALLQPADVLILDEPTNHLDAEMVGRAHQPSGRRDGGMAGAEALRFPRRHRHGHPRPLLPRAGRHPHRGTEPRQAQLF